jgi:hypothetical protein
LNISDAGYMELIDPLTSLTFGIGADGSTPRFVRSSDDFHMYKIGDNLSLNGFSLTRVNANRQDVKVRGLIETTQQGVKFPDATIQTTAYTGSITAANVSLTSLRLLGRGSVGTGAGEEIQVGAGLELTTGGILKSQYGANLIVIADANHTVAATEGSVLYNSATTTRTLTIPAASSNAHRIIHIVGPPANNLTLSVTVKQSGGSTFNTLTTGQKKTIQSDGTDWWEIQ